MPVRAVLFDLFDTLVDLPMDELPRVQMLGRSVPSTTGALHEAVATRHPVAFEDFVGALAEVDREWRERAWREGFELPTLERFARLAERLDLDEPELPARLTDIHMGLLAALVRTPPHHAALLEALHEQVRLGLCSNFSHAPTALAILEKEGLRAPLDAVAISHEVGLRKPRPEIFRAALAALGVEPHEALHVGDNLVADVAGAESLGIPTVWITRRVPDPAAARAAHPEIEPDWIIRDLEEIGPILEDLD